jgi:hypothetical protein
VTEQGNVPRVEKYRFGRIVVDGKAHGRDVIVLPDQVVEGWWRKQSHTLLPDDLEPVFRSKPDLLVVGQGAMSRLRIPSETRRALESVGIELIAQPSSKACKTYNAVAGQRRVALAIHLTC